MPRHRRSFRIHPHPLTLQDCITCPKCGTDRELEYFYVIRNYGKSGLGYSAWCKFCVNEYRKSREDSRVYVNARTGLHEIRCPRCEEAKPTLEFYRENYVFSKLCKRCTRISRIAAE